MRKTYKVIKIRKDGKWISIDEHRYIMELYLGRKLKYNEVIYHKNGNPKDNRIKNLELISRSIHAKNHSKKPKMIIIICSYCNKKISFRKAFYNWRKKKQKEFFCSRKCFNKRREQNKKNNSIYKLIKKEYTNGLTGYGISKKYNLNRKTVYNYINQYFKNQP